MNIVGVRPARYASNSFPDNPLADIYVNIRLDEPILESFVIQTAVNIMLDDNYLKCASIKILGFIYLNISRKGRL